MSIGFPAYSKGSQKFKMGQRELGSVVGKVLDSLGWSYEREGPSKFLARCAANLWTSGEKIEVEVLIDGTVMVKSRCVLITQFIDWGKNWRNVRAFFAEVDRMEFVSEISPAPVAAFDLKYETPIERVIKGSEREGR